MARQDRTGFAVGVMVATDLTLSIADAVIKVTLADMPLAQFIFLRACISLPLLVLILRIAFPGTALWPVRPGWASLRSALLLSSLLVYYAALPRLDLSLAAAAYYTIPLFIALFAALWLSDPVGPRGWIGVGLGFGGVLLMLRPDAGDLNLYAFLPLLSAVLYALAMVLTRSKARDENPFVLAMVFNAMAIVLGGGASLAAPEAWVAMGWAEWALVVGLAGAMLVGSVGTALAYQSAPPAVVSTWDFSYLAFAVLWGVLLFGERLEPLSAAGIALIALAGIIVLRRSPIPPPGGKGASLHGRKPAAR